MPLRLTNARNNISSQVLNLYQVNQCRCFCDNIMIYSPSLEAHWKHLREVLKIMKEHKLFSKLNKCSFAKEKVEYLRHIISRLGL